MFGIEAEVARPPITQAGAEMGAFISRLTIRPGADTLQEKRDSEGEARDETGGGGTPGNLTADGITWYADH